MARAILTLYLGGLIFALVLRLPAPWWWWTFGVVACLLLIWVISDGRWAR